MTCSCGRPVDGTTLCSRCRHTLDVALANIPAYAADAELTEARRKGVRYDLPRGKGGTKEQPLAFHPKAGDALRGARNTVGGWCRVILEEHPAWPGPRRDTLQSACGWLQANLGVIAVAVWAEECLADLLAAERALWRVGDHQVRQYVGRCSAGPENPCQAELYAEEDAATTTCPACGTRHDVADRRGFLLTEAKEYLVTASEAAGALVRWTDYGGTERGLADLIRKWRDRGRLEARGRAEVGGRSRDLYRLGDVQERLIEHAQREQERRMVSA